MLQNASRMIINIQSGQHTEVIVMRLIDERRRDFTNGTPTLNLCIGSGS